MEPLIRLSGVTMRWADRDILSDIDLTVNRGDFLTVTGPNGGGKTTLLRIMLRLLHPTEGEVAYFGSDGMPCRKLPIGYLPQKNTIDSRFPVSVREVVASGLIMERGIGAELKRERVDEVLELVELTQHASKPIGSLSGGQLQRALLGRALAARPHILVLDEPLSYLDKHFEGRIYDILAGIKPTSTVVLVSHELSVISSMATRHLIVDHKVHECVAHRHYVSTDCR